MWKHPSRKAKVKRKERRNITWGDGWKRQARRRRGARILVSSAKYTVIYEHPYHNHNAKLA
jgi:hypothetical protein